MWVMRDQHAEHLLRVEASILEVRRPCLGSPVLQSAGCGADGQTDWVSEALERKHVFF